MSVWREMQNGRKKKESKKVKNGFEKKRLEIAGKKGRALPMGFSALYPLCVQSNLCTRTSACNWNTG